MDITELDLLLRTVASPARLRILAVLLGSKDADAECRPKAIAASLGVSRPAVSHHLKILLRMRLIRYWKKGVAKTYAAARPRQDSPRARLLGRLRDELPDSIPAIPVHRRRGGDQRTRPPRHAGIGKGGLADVWNGITAYSHFRRILMLSAFLREGAVSRRRLAEVTNLDRKTVKYHVSKLLRRGVLSETPAGLVICTRQPSPFQQFIQQWISPACAG